MKLFEFEVRFSKQMNQVSDINFRFNSTLSKGYHDFERRESPVPHHFNTDDHFSQYIVLASNAVAAAELALDIRKQNNDK